MKPVPTLPAGYVAAGTLDLAKNRRALLWISLLGLVLMVIFGALFIFLLAVIRPEAIHSIEFSHLFGLKSPQLELLCLLAVLSVMLVVHEGIHGLFFWVFSHARPVFGFKGVYAYAGMPGWYFPRASIWLLLFPPLS